MIRALLTVVLLLAAVPASAQRTADDRIFVGALAGYAGAAIWDARATRQCVEAGTCSEVNPALRPFANRHGIRAAMAGKLVVQAGIAGGLMALRPKYGWKTTAALAALTGIQFAVDVHNYRQVHPR